jgi:hypothetical protein
MTHDEIMKLEAGRELDALVAEHVMGWVWRDTWNNDGTLSATWLRPENVFNYGVRVKAGEVSYLAGLPRYSTDIAAAWQVVGKLQSPPDECFFEITMTPTIPHNGGHCWHTRIGGFFAHAPTAPLSICRAALLVAFGLPQHDILAEMVNGDL